jgi:long-chain acyl-CoA synthetase
MNLATVLDRHATDAVALISRGKATTYAELHDQVAHLRGGFGSLELDPGDRVGIVAANNWYFVASYLSIIGSGLVAVPLNPTSPPAELVSELANVGARAVVIGPAARERFAEIDRAELTDVEHFIGCGFTPDGGLDLDGLMAVAAAPIADVDDDDIAVMVFTSGTAGSPKAAMLSHGNLRANIAQVLSMPGTKQEPGDVSFGLLPLFHIFGLNVVLGVTLTVGAAVLLVERFDPMSALEAIEKHRVTVVLGPPTMWAALAAMPVDGSEMLRNVRIAVSGAARLPDEVVRGVEARYGVTVRDGYGLTEASPVVTASAGSDAPSGSVGVAVPGLELRIVDTSGDDVLVGDAGELWVRGPNVFRGYFNDAEASARAVDAEGWLHTGDVATVDDDGYIYLVDRVKDLIIVSGFNVYPAEVEEVLMDHPAIEACAVVGVPHPYSGEAVKAYVVTVAGESVEENDIISFCASRLARYKCPEKIWFVDEVPMGMGGKILRRALR